MEVERRRGGRARPTRLGRAARRDTGAPPVPEDRLDHGTIFHTGDDPKRPAAGRTWRKAAAENYARWTVHHDVHEFFAEVLVRDGDPKACRVAAGCRSSARCRSRDSPCSRARRTPSPSSRARCARGRSSSCGFFTTVRRPASVPPRTVSNVRREARRIEVERGRRRAADEASGDSTANSGERVRSERCRTGRRRPIDARIAVAMLPLATRSGREGCVKHETLAPLARRACPRLAVPWE